DIKADGSNPGLLAASKAAHDLGGRVAVPVMDGKACDFWGLWHEHGAGAVRLAVESAQTPTKTAVTAVTKTESVTIPAEDRPCYRVFNTAVKVLESVGPLRADVWFFNVKIGKGDEPPALTQQWVC